MRKRGTYKVHRGASMQMRMSIGATLMPIGAMHAKEEHREASDVHEAHSICRGTNMQKGRRHAKGAPIKVKVELPYESLATASQRRTPLRPIATLFLRIIMPILSGI